MDPLEEQTQELEVLESIYPDELEKFTETHFSIKIKLDTSSNRVHVLELDIKYPPEYPEVVPELDITVAEDEEEEYDSDDDNNGEDSEDDEETKAAKKALNMSETIDFDGERLQKLKEKLEEEAEIQIGIPMIFALASQLKDDAEQLFEEMLSQSQEDYDKQLLIREKAEQKKFNGTPVTKETFTEWSLKFKDEMKFEEKLAEKFRLMHMGKYTGREIFEKGLAKEEDE